MRIVLLVMIFLVFSALLIISNQSLEMYKQKNVVTFVDLYSKWIGDLFSNFKTLTGQAIKMDWVPNHKV